MNKRHSNHWKSKKIRKFVTLFSLFNAHRAKHVNRVVRGLDRNNVFGIPSTVYTGISRAEENVRHECHIDFFEMMPYVGGGRGTVIRLDMLVREKCNHTSEVDLLRNSFSRGCSGRSVYSDSMDMSYHRPAGIGITDLSGLWTIQL
ncbi:hypothetical protein QTP88_012087 [Uroleucon formosanum]